MEIIHWLLMIAGAITIVFGLWCEWKDFCYGRKLKRQQDGIQELDTAGICLHFARKERKSK